LADADTPDADTVAPRAPAHTLDLPTLMESGGVEPWFNVYRPMDLDATGEPLPVIVWANGGCFRSDFTWAPLFERWAAGGLVVLALTEHPVNGALAQTTAEEQGQLIDWALAQADAEGMYQGKLDKERIVAAGNSCGGVTALGLTAGDERVASVFVLSGSSAFAGANTAVMSAIKVPVGYVVGGPEDIAGANATADYEALAADVPAMIISRNMGDHMTVSTDTMILPEVAEMALNWLDLTLYGTPEAAAALTSATVCEGCTAGTWSLEARLLDTLVR
jgi:predicted dienelactone hydrolase